MRIFSRAREHGVPLLLLLLSAAITYRDYLTGALLFTGKDFLTCFAPLLNYQSDCLQAGSLPLWNPFMNFGYPFVEHYVNSLFFPTHLILGLVTGSSIVSIQREIIFWILVGGGGVYFFAREEGCGATAALLAGISFMFCGQMIALPHWHVLVYNAACFPWMMFGWRLSLKSDSALSLTTVAFISCSIFGGYLVSTVLGLYLYAGYVGIDSLFNKRFRLGLRHIAISFLCSALIAAPKLLPIYQAMRSATRLNAAIAKDPYNIINGYSFLTWLMPVKFYFSLYIGVICVLCLCYALIRRSVRVNTLLIMFILSAWLLAVDASGDFSYLRHLSFHLPFMKLVRNEWLQWFFPCTFAIAYAAKPIDHFINDPVANNARFSALLLFFGILAAVYGLACNTDLHLKTFLTQAVLATTITAICLTVKQPRLLAAILFILVLSDFTLTSKRVRVDKPHITRSDGIDVTITHQIGASRSLRDNQLVSQSFPMHILNDSRRPSLGDSRNFTRLSSGLDGDFTNSMNFKRFAGWWYNTQERRDFERLKESPQLAAMEGLPLYILMNPQSGSPMGQASFDAISCSDFRFTATLPEQGSFLLHQAFDKRWRLTVDGIGQPIQLFSNYFMRTNLPPGVHSLEFKFIDNYFMLGAAISAITIAILGLATFFKNRMSHITASRKT